MLFRSIGNPDIAYTMHAQSLDYDLRRYGPYVDSHAGMFLVYNDWPVQHSTESCVPVGQFSDWINSLAAHLVANPLREDDLAMLADNWPRSNPENEKIVLACKIKYREDKRQYYSLQEEKVSTAESKRHDKRWEDVPSWADGGLSAVFGLVSNGGWRDLLHRYQLAEDCVTVYRRINGSCLGYGAAEKLVDVDYAGTMPAWAVCRELVQAYRLQRNAIEMWRRKTESDAYKAARQAELAAV